MAEESKKQCTCLVENSEKYITFTVPIEQEITRIDKNGEEITKNMSYMLQFNYSARLLQVLYQILLIIFLREFIKLDVNTAMLIKNMKHMELNISLLTVFWSISTLKMI